MFNSLINQSFKNAHKEKRPALITYTVAGDNTKKNSLKHVENFSLEKVTLDCYKVYTKVSKKK